jgi:hypothetical protein
MKWEGNLARMGEKRSVYMVLVGKLEGKRPLEKPSRRREDNIKIDLQEVGFGGMDLIELAQELGQVAGTCKSGNETSGSIKCGGIS